MFRNGLVFRVIGVLLLIGLIAAGGFMAFKAGEANGISQAPAVATAIAKAAENGQAVNVPPMMYGHAYGYGPGYPMMYGHHHFGFFPGGICFSILFLFLFFGFLKMIFFRGMRHGHHRHGPWGRNWEDGVPPMFNDWHKRAHGEKPEEESDKKE
ncbi:MAG: hypothetical protein JNM55_06705 [Anaerolineales bacterium]|nr:hypothetical protein [Anaerolineales bacterium]